MKRIIILMLSMAIFASPAVLPAQEAQPSVDSTRIAIVKEMLIAGNYVYLLVVEEGEEIWLATGPHFVNNIKYGDIIEFLAEVEMQDFHSNGLDRTFASLWFVSRIRVKQDDATDGGTEEETL
jgi:hypothetical protein